MSYKTLLSPFLMMSASSSSLWSQPQFLDTYCGKACVGVSSINPFLLCCLSARIYLDSCIYSGGKWCLHVVFLLYKYFPVLLSNPNTMFAAEILQGRGIELFNNVENVEVSLYFHVLILKEVKGKHHQPAKTPFQSFAYLNPFHLKSCPFLSHHWGRGVKRPLNLSESFE